MEVINYAGVTTYEFTPEILSITETDNIIHDKHNYEGYVVKTDKGDIKLLLTNGQCCCEDHGYNYLSTSDDLDNFVGEKIIKIESDTVSVENEDTEFLDNGAYTTLTIRTNKDSITFYVYNSHNGYYSHGGVLALFDRVKDFEI